MPTTRDIPTGVVLSLVGDKLMVRERVETVFDALAFLSGDPANPPNNSEPNQRALRAYLIAQYPQLADWDDADVTVENWQEKLDKAIALYGETLTLAPMPEGIWERRPA